MTAKQKDEKSIFKAALELKTPPERTAYVEKVCAADPALKERILALLKAREHKGDFLEALLDEPAVSLEDQNLEEKPDTVIGRYKLLEQIGEGGMAVVYMAEQQEPIHRKVALKIIKLGMDTKSVIARFEAERQALAMMEHPNIAKVLDAGATDTGRPYFVMELVKGASITDFCDINNLSTHERLELFVQICQAVQHAHQKGIIHRDIKPTNVMVTLHDGVPIPKVIDFGIAKAVNHRLTEKTLFTRYAQMIGTPAYMSPEQAEMSGLDIDIRTDVFSLGTLLYELLTGSPPFESEYLLSKSYEEMQRIIREEEPARPSTKISTLGEALIDVAKYRNTSPEALHKLIRSDLDWIVMKTLEKDRDRRYDTVSEFAADIKRHLNHEPVLAGPPNTLYCIKKFIQRHRVFISATTAIITTILIGLAATTVMYYRAEHSRRKEAMARTEAQNIIDFLTNDLLASVYPEKTKSQEVTVRYLLETASKNIENKFSNNPLSEAAIRETLSLTYQKLGDYKAAEPHLKRALDIHRVQLGEEHPTTLASLDHLGRLYWYQGRRKEAETLLTNAFMARDRILGSEHPDTLESLSHLAWLNVCLGSKGNDLVRQAYETAHRVLGADHPITLDAAASLAFKCLMDGRISEAEALAPSSYELSRRVLGEEHETTLILMNTLAWLYEKQQRYDKGVLLAKETLQIAQRVLGEAHIVTIHAMGNLGSLYTHQGSYEEAAQLLVHAVEIAKQHLGENHAFTYFCKLKLGILYHRQGRYDEHEELFIELLTNARRSFGRKSRYAGYSKYWLRLRSEELAQHAEEQTASGDREGASATLARLEQIHRALKGDSRKSIEEADK